MPQATTKASGRPFDETFGDEGTLTKSDLAQLKRDARAHEAEQRAAAESAMRDEGVDPASGLPAPAPPAPASSQAFLQAFLPTKVGSGGTLAGAVLGAFAYFLGLAYLRGGPAAAKAWLAAKFVNKITTTTASTSATSQPSLT